MNWWIDNNRYFFKKKETIKPRWKKWLLALAIEEIEINTKMTYLSQINMNTIKRYMYIQWKRKENHLWGCKWEKTLNTMDEKSNFSSHYEEKSKSSL